MEDDYDRKLREYEEMLKDMPDDEEDANPRNNEVKKEVNVDFDEYEKMLLEAEKNIPTNKMDIEKIEKPKEEKKPVVQEKPVVNKPQATSPKKNIAISFIENEEKYSNPEIIKSFVIIKQELDYLGYFISFKNVYLDQGLKNKNLDKKIIEYLFNKKEKIKNNKTALAKMITSGQLNGKSYSSLVENLFSQHMKIFAAAKQTGDKSILTRISGRMGGLDKEKTQLKKNPEGEFKGLLKAFAPELANVSINPNATFKSEPISKEPERFTSNIASRPLSDFQGNLSVSSLFLSECDKYSPVKKIVEIRKRHKEYHNLALYWAKHVQ